MKRQSIVYFYRSENTLYDPVKMDPCYYTFGPTCRIYTARMDCKVKYGLWMIMICQCRLISCNRCTTLLEDTDNGWKDGLCMYGVNGVDEISTQSPVFCEYYMAFLRTRVLFCFTV